MKVQDDFWFLFCALWEQNHTETSTINVFGFILPFFFLNHVCDSIYDENFDSFTLSHLIVKLVTNLNLNMLLSICLSMPMCSFMNNLMIKWFNENKSESVCSIILFINTMNKDFCFKSLSPPSYLKTTLTINFIFHEDLNFLIIKFYQWNMFLFS